MSKELLDFFSFNKNTPSVSICNNVQKYFQRLLEFV